jgi:hypothetical protein
MMMQWIKVLHTYTSFSLKPRLFIGVFLNYAYFMFSLEADKNDFGVMGIDNK